MRPLFIICLIPLCFAMACNRCEDDAEPLAGFHFHQRYYDSAYAIQQGKNLPSITCRNSCPISLLSDTTIYVFIDSDKRDTLAFSYQRNFNLESQYCGVTVELDHFTILDKTTFDSVSVEVLMEVQTIFGESNHNAYVFNIY